MDEQQQSYELTATNVQLTAEQTMLCQGLAEAVYGDANKVENIIKDALEGYVAKRKGIVKDDMLFEKLSELILVSGFEAAQMQMMIKEMYCRDKKAIANYENIRKAAAMKMEQQFGQIHAEKKLELQETVRQLTNEVERLASQIHVLTEEKTVMQERYLQKLAASERDYNEMTVALKAYIKLNEWQEQRVKETPKIREQNSGILKTQSWESAIAEFEYYHQRPNVPQT